MKRSGFVKALAAISGIGAVFGMIFALAANPLIGIVIMVGGINGAFVLWFASAVLSNLESISETLQDMKKAFLAPQRKFPQVKPVQHNIFETTADIKSDTTTVCSRPIPPAPEIDELQRKEAMDRIKASGFKSTEKFKTANYTIAIDINRHEWAVISPDGHQSDTHKMAEYRRSEINKYGLGVEVLVYFTDSDIQPLHIVLVDGSGHSVMPIKDAEGEAKRIVSMLESMEASVKV